MAPPGKEEVEGEQQERRDGLRAEEDAPRDVLAEMMARLRIDERETAVALARLWEEEAAAAGDRISPALLGHHRGTDPRAYAPAPMVRDTGPVAPSPMLPAPVGMPLPPRDCGVLDARRFTEGHLRRGNARGLPNTSVPPLPLRAVAAAARGVLPGDHAYMAPPPLQRFLHGGAVAFNPHVEDPDLFLTRHEQALLLALFRQTPEAIVSYACDLMESRHGQRLFKLVLNHCDHVLRECVVATITRDKRSFRRICAQRTEEVVFMIKSCTTRGSMRLLRDAIVPWTAPDQMPVLLSDSNRLRVVQTFVLTSPPDIAQLIFDAVAQNCTRLACQPHGLSLLQNCLDCVSWMDRDNIFAKISYKSLHLAQNPCGNYIVQDVLKNGDPSHFAIIAACLRSNYVGLSRHKYSSRVVEWCLRVFGEAERLVIVNELLCYPHFRELVTDQFANFVISTALETCNFPLRNILANAILSQNINVRNHYSTKIFHILSKSGFI